ncbi:hypothetical protein K7432_015858 [Basidiobolus ranarum]|uniref:Cytochrome P450 n=1 Tax=Basidiobolus ranarum TaxID=34480 RepID=A0ABR2WFL3_9FUNG
MMFITGVLVSLALLAAYAIYVKKSPYSHIPGPKGNPFFGHIFQLRFEELIRDLENWAWEYGPVFHLRLFTKSCLVISDVQMCHDILKARPDGFSRGAGLAKVAKDFNADGIFTHEGDEWRHSRYWIATAFSPTKVREFKKCVWYHSKKLQGKLSDIADQQKVLLDQQYVDSAASTTSKFPIKYQYHGHDLTDTIMKEIQSTILSIVCDVSFSWGDADFLSADVLERSKIFLARIFERAFSTFPIWKLYKSEKDRIAESMKEEFDHRIQTLIETRYKTQTKDNRESQTLLDTLMKSTLEVDGEADDLSEKRRRIHRLTHSQMKANLLIVVMAGYETTATVMSWILYELAKCPRYQERIRAEVKQAFGDINQFDIDHDPDTIEKILNSSASQIPFVHSFIQETLRLHSVAPLSHLSAIKDQEIQGVKIKKGTDIFMLSRVATLRSWPTSAPLKFNPEQWLGENGETEGEIKTMNQLGLTFGFGPRVCPGRHLAETELIVLTAMISSNFKLSLIDTLPADEPVMEKVLFTAYPGNLHIRIEQYEDST